MQTFIKNIFLLCLLPLSLFANDVDNNESMFTDSSDGYLDMSKFLASKEGFLPVPMIITGPTFGLGGGVNIMFLHDKLMSKKNTNGHYIPPSISGVVVGATENGTKFAAAYHIGFYLDGNLRTTTFFGHPDANMEFGTTLGDVSLNTNGYLAYQELKYRLFDTSLFLGANYTYMHMKTSPNDVPKYLEKIADSLSNEQTYAGLALVLEYDSRDSIFTPDKGLYAKALVDFYSDTVGSDKNFINYRAKSFYYYPISKKLNLGLRGEYQSINGSDRAPAFMTPSLILRGMSNHKYQGQSTALGEVEMRYEVFHRNFLLGFAGTGKVYGDYSSEGEQSFSDASFHSSYGIGYRYELAKKFKLLAGFDIAKSQTDTAFYITVGSAWNAFY